MLGTFCENLDLKPFALVLWLIEALLAFLEIACSKKRCHTQKYKKPLVGFTFSSNFNKLLEKKI